MEAPLRGAERAMLAAAVESLSRLEGVEHDSSELLVLEGWLGGERCRNVLVDAGASSNFVHSSWVRRHRLPVERLVRPLDVRMADGGSMGQLTGAVQVNEAVVNGSRAPCRLIVTDTLAYDAILGMPWLRNAGVTLGCGVDDVMWNGRPLQMLRRSSDPEPLLAASGHSTEPEPARQPAASGLHAVPEREPRPASSGPAATEGTRTRTGASMTPQLCAIKVGAEHEARFEALRQRYGDVFRSELPKRTEANPTAVHHEIQLKDPNCRPVACRERRRSPKETQAIIDQVKEMEAAGLIEDSVSPWSAQSLFVGKKREGVVLKERRFCLDFRGLNERTVRDAHPLPLPEMMFDHLQGARLFSKLDLLKGFWQIPLRPKTRELLAFSTPLGLKQPRYMPFGIMNAPATFQREMQRVLKDRLYKGVLVFIDDILIYSRSVEEHVELVEFVLRRLKEEGYYAHPDKCEFFQQQVSFLGHVVSADGVAVQQHKVRAVKEWPTPTSKTEVKAFLGLTGYYRKFIQGYSQIALPLTELTKDKPAFTWTAAHQLAFDRLKTALQTAPVLRHADPALPYHVHTDASGFATSAVLSQDQGAGLQPVAYFSRKMNEAERRYPVHEQELLAVVQAMREWRCYLHGSPFNVHIHTDHRSLQWISTQPTLSQRQARWVEGLQDFSFTIEYVAGKENRVADALSRRSDYEQEATAETLLQRSSAQPQQRLELRDAATVTAAAARTRRAALQDVKEDDGGQGAVVADDGVRQAGQQTGLQLSELLVDIGRAATQDAEYQLRVGRASHMGLVVKDGLLYTEDGILYVPDDLEIKRRILHELHDAPTGGHVGVTKTLKRLRERVYWYGMDRDVLQYVRSCVSCAAKPGHQLPAGQLVPLPIPRRPWETISMDFIGPLPRTARYKDAVLVVIDKLTKMGHFIPTTTQLSAKQTAELIFNEIVRLHGVPSNIISDRDPRFTSGFWKELWRLLGTQLRLSTAYHPQTDGQTERANRVVEDMLRAYVNQHRTDWDQFLVPVEIAYNSSTHESTGFTPYHLNGGQQQLPLDIALGRPGVTNVEAVQDLLAETRQHLEDARLLLMQRQQKQKQYADRRRRDERYAVGDEVMLATKGLAHRHKLTDAYVGPFRVTEVIGDVNVRLDLPDAMGRTHPVFHVEKLKRYVRSTVDWPGRRQHDRPPPVWVDGEEKWEVDRIIGKREKWVTVPVDAEEEPVPDEGASDEAKVSDDATAGLRRSARLRSHASARSAPLLQHRHGRVRRATQQVRQIQYLVAWKGWDDSQATWQTEADLALASDAVEDYEHQQRLTRGEEAMGLLVIATLDNDALGHSPSGRQCNPPRAASS